LPSAIWISISTRWALSRYGSIPPSSRTPSGVGPHPRELALVTRALDAFTRDQGSPARFVWECPSHSGGIGNFQFGLVEEEDNGTVSVQLGRFTFDAKVRVPRLAFEEFRDNTNFRTSYTSP
jgi:hypothetical protein